MLASTKHGSNLSLHVPRQSKKHIVEKLRISLRDRDSAMQAMSVGEGAILLLGNETAFQQAEITQPEIGVSRGQAFEDP